VPANDSGGGPGAAPTQGVLSEALAPLQSLAVDFRSFPRFAYSSTLRVIRDLQTRVKGTQRNARSLCGAGCPAILERWSAWQWSKAQVASFALHLL